MSNPMPYRSVLAPFMDELLRIKRSQGMDSTTLSWVLHDLDSYAIQVGLKDTFITEEWYDTWKRSQTNVCDRTLYHKCSAWKQLLTLMSKKGYQCFIPRLPHPPKSTFVPYIFSQTQITALFKSIDNQEYRHKTNKRNGLMAMPAFLRLLYSTGLRVSEVLSLTNADVQLSLGIIKIRNSKNGSERIVAVCESMRNVLQSYIEYRNKISIRNINDPEKPFLIRLDGSSITKETVYRFFYRSCEDAGIELGGRLNGPTVHSLRHTSATHALVQMANAGMDVYTALPILSASLGHMKPSSTEYYVRLTKSMFPEIEENISSIAEFIFSK